jgi:hypothetical protein
MVIALHIHNRKFWGEEETSLHKTSNELLGSGGFIQIVRLLKLGQLGLTIFRL